MKKDQLKILVLDHETGFIGPSCFRAFQELGHDAKLLVLKADGKTKALNPIDLPAILTEIISYGPAFILDINGKGCDRDGISLYAYKILGIPLFVWFLDNPLIFLDYDRYRYSSLFIKLVFDRFIEEEMKTIGITDTHHLPLGTDIVYFKPLLLESGEKRRYDAGISFVGNLRADYCYVLRKLLNDRWPDMPAVMNDVMDYSIRLLADGEKMTTSDAIQKALGHLEIKPVYPVEDIEWMINIIVEHESAVNLRVEMIRPLLKYGIKLYGDSSWSGKLNGYKINPPVSYFEGLPGIYNSTAINLNISKTQLRTAVNQRVFDVPACRAFLLTDYREELEEYFVIGKDVACYKDKEELCRLVAYYLDNPGARERIADAGYERVIREHTYAERMKKVMEIYDSLDKEGFMDIDEKGDSWDKANLCIGQAYLKIGDREKAKYYFQRGLNPGSGNYIKHLNSAGISLLRSMEYSDCIAVFKEASALDPGEPSFLTNLGLAYEHLGQYEEAEDCYKKALEVDARYQPAIKNIRCLNRKKTIKSPPLLRQFDSSINSLLTAQDKAYPSPDTQLGGEGKGQPKLSLCMIVRNEEAVLASCLESVKGIVDEIVIVDTGSTDRTCDIASIYGAKVIHHVWKDDFSEPRNVSIKNAAGDYILWLDGDEYIDNDSRETLLKLKPELPANKDEAYSVIITSSKDDKEDESFRRLRIFPNLPDIKFKGRVHEDVAESLNTRGIKVISADVVVLHRGYKSDEEVKSKVMRNLPILLAQLDETPDDTIISFYLGNSYYCLGETTLAIEYMEKVTQCRMKSVANSPWFPFAFIKLAQLYRESGRGEDALSVYGDMLSKSPQFTVGHFFRGEMLYFMGKFEDALIEFNHVIIDKIEVCEFPLPVKKVGYLNLYYSGCCLMEMGRYREAADCFVRAMEMDPESLNLHISSTRLFALSGDVASCVESCGRILKTLEMDRGCIIESIDDLAAIFREIGSVLEGLCMSHEAVEAYKTSLAILEIRDCFIDSY